MTADKAPPPNRTQIPNIIDDLGLDPYERALYVHYKRVCGENQGAYCFEATKTTAQKVKMSSAQVSVSRRMLAERGLIIIQEGRPLIITVINIWETNQAFYQLEHKPDIDGWTVREVKLWLTDVHTVNVSSHNDSNIVIRSETNLTEDVADIHTVNEDSYSERKETINNTMSSYVHTVKQRSKESLNKDSVPRKESERESRAALTDQVLETCGYSLEYLSNGTAEKVNGATAQLVRWKATPELVKDFGISYWWGENPPTVKQLLDDWSKFMTWKKNGAKSQKASRNGVQSRASPLTPEQAEIARRMAEEEKSQIHNPLNRS